MKLFKSVICLILLTFFVTSCTLEDDIIEENNNTYDNITIQIQSTGDDNNSGVDPTEKDG